MQVDLDCLTISTDTSINLLVQKECDKPLIILKSYQKCYSDIDKCFVVHWINFK